jgi:diguanylate cyclase (GGDEF)-like protein
MKKNGETTVSNIQKILVIGGGRGGTAMLDLFGEDPMIQIVGIFDENPNAPALKIAKERGISVFTALNEALDACRPCLVFNLTGDESVTKQSADTLGAENIIGGFQARFLWGLLTRLKQTNEQIAHLAYHDSLTGLPNRMLFYDRLNNAMLRSNRDNNPLAVMYLDLDGFKKVNDSYGHSMGDMLLREAAKRITSCVRETDTVSRMGGDEFTVILVGLNSTYANERAAKDIVEALARPFVLNGKTCIVTASLGVAIYPIHAESPEQLVRIADAAMYVAKNSGKNCYRFAEVPEDKKPA